MKAVLMHVPGDPEVLVMGDYPDPVPGPTDLLVQIKAIGVNPIDVKLRQRGTFFPERTPAVLGCDAAGIVMAVGRSVQRFQVGDAVYFCHGGLGADPGTYATFATVDERFAAHKPVSLSFEQAAAAPLVLITAWEALFDRVKLQLSNRVLVHGGAGGVGHVAIQLAKSQGAVVATTVSSPEKAAFVEKLRADRVILYTVEDFAQATLQWTNGQGANAVLDTVGGETLMQSFPAVKFGGDIVSLLEPQVSNWKTARERNLRISLELMLTPQLQNLPALHEHQAWILQQCAQLFDRGSLQIEVSHSFPLEDAAEAHRLLEKGGMQGKIVLVP